MSLTRRWPRKLVRLPKRTAKHQRSAKNQSHDENKPMEQEKAFDSATYHADSGATGKSDAEVNLAVVLMCDDDEKCTTWHERAYIYDASVDTALKRPLVATWLYAGCAVGRREHVYG